MISNMKDGKQWLSWRIKGFSSIEKTILRAVKNHQSSCVFEHSVISYSDI